MTDFGGKPVCSPLVRRLYAIAASLTHQKLRAMALFFVMLMLFGASSTTVLALAAPAGPSAADIANAANKQHKTSTTPSIGKINTKSPPALPVTPAKPAPAVDAAQSVAASSSQFLGKLTGKANNEALSGPVDKPTFQPHELTDKRTADTSSYLNSDGTVTETDYAAPHFYQESGSWKAIDTTLVKDKNAADSVTDIARALCL